MLFIGKLVAVFAAAALLFAASVAPANAATQTLNFEDGILIPAGDYPVGNTVLNFPANNWLVANNYGPDSSHLIRIKTMIGSSGSAQFQVYAPRYLTSFDIVTSNFDGGSWSLACTGNPTVSDISVNSSQITYFTGWTHACTGNVVFSVTRGAGQANIPYLDNLVFNVPSAVLGNNQIQATSIGMSSGTVAYRFTSATATVVNRFNLYLTTGSSAPPGVIQVGVYSDLAGEPYNIIIPPSPCNMNVAVGTLPGWHQCVIPSHGTLSTVAGAKYWLSVYIVTPNWGSVMKVDLTGAVAPRYTTTPTPAVWNGAGQTCGCGYNPSFFMDFVL